MPRTRLTSSPASLVVPRDVLDSHENRQRTHLTLLLTDLRILLVYLLGAAANVLVFKALFTRR